MKTYPCAPGLMLVRSLVVTICVLLTHMINAQVRNFPKISPTLLNELRTKEANDTLDLYITLKENESQFFPNKTERVHMFSAYGVYRISLTVKQLDSFLQLLPQILFVESGNRKAKEELIIGSLDLSVNKINLVHKNFSAINGEGVVVSVKENKPDTSDIDLRGRYLTTHLSSNTVNSHASVMATMIAGGGNSWHLGKGAAWGSTISSSNFALLLPDANTAYQQYNISVQNHSYGVGIENYYGSDAAAYDASAITRPSLLHVFSSGNSGTSASTTGVYSGVNGFANLTGSFKMAKNVLTVGATDSFSAVAGLSSKGPAHDGRVKPEMVAYGEDGSSGAAALVSGTVLLLQHYYKQTNGFLPANALIKSILINSADDVGNTEVDYKSGYGALNADNAMRTLQSNRYFSGTVSNSGSQSFLINVPAGIKKLKATLVWNDPPAAPNANKALINDLDLELTDLSSGQIWQPWVLNSFPHIDSLHQFAKRKKDSLNNTEQITIDNPAAGIYEVKVTGFSITTSAQSFHVAWQLDSAGKFEWQFPVANDFIFPSTINNIRWQSSFAAANGVIEYSINGMAWQPVHNPADLASGHLYWNVPALTGVSQLRMTIGSNVFVSDTFTIAARTTTGIGFNCPDTFLIYWNKLPTVANYRVYRLGNKYLEPLTVTGDSFLLLSKLTNPSFQYAVEPMIGAKEGVKSYTFNYTLQGVECYIRSFLALLSGSSADLTLSLGTLYNVKKIVLEKFHGSAFSAIQTISNPGSLINTFTDAQLSKGQNIYRIKLELEDGRVIYSSTETVYYFNGNEFIVYPNPAHQYQSINILSDNQSEPASLQVINMQGQKVYEMRLNDLTNQIPAGALSKGVYLFNIIRKGQRNVVLKMVVH